MSDDEDTAEKLDARKERVFEAKNNVSGKISESCRYVGFGLLAIFYSVRFGDATMQAVGNKHSWLVLAIGILGFLAILFDYLQYYFGYRAIDDASKATNYKYYKESFSYRAWNFFFDYKQYVVIFGVVAVVLLFFSDSLPSCFTKTP